MTNTRRTVKGFELELLQKLVLATIISNNVGGSWTVVGVIHLVIQTVQKVALYMRNPQLVHTHSL